jgi:hypothetical protein
VSPFLANDTMVCWFASVLEGLYSEQTSPPQHGIISEKNNGYQFWFKPGRMYVQVLLRS